MQGIKRVLALSVMLLVVLLSGAGCSGAHHMDGAGAAPAGGTASNGGTASSGETAGTGAPAVAAVRVEVGYLSHPPIRVAVDEVNKILETYGDKIQVSRYDLESQDGKAFAERVKLTVHTPLAIYINGQMEVTGKEGQKVKLFSFPAGVGTGTGMTPGSGWTLDDLKAALDRAVGGQK